VKDIQQHFEEFDAANPEVWERFVEMALRLIELGFKRHSSDALLHAIRMQRDLKTTGAGEAAGKQLKVNNSMSSRYARKFQKHYPMHADFFETRRLKTDRPIAGATPRHDAEVNAGQLCHA
jgi:hypothetical protein